MSQEEQPLNHTEQGIPEDPHFGIDSRFTHQRGSADSPNSGPEHNPDLELKHPFLSLPHAPEGRVVFNPQAEEQSHAEPGE